MHNYIVYICNVEEYYNGVPVKHVDAKSAAEVIAFKHTGIERVRYISTIYAKPGLCKVDIHVYEDEHGNIYNVHRDE
jgi:hypothetical protein